MEEYCPQTGSTQGCHRSRVAKKGQFPQSTIKWCMSVQPLQLDFGYYSYHMSFFFNPLTFSLFVSYSFLYYLLSVFLAYFFVPFFLLSACFWGKEAFHWTLAGNPGWGFCSLLRPVRQ